MLLARAILQIFEITSLGISSISRKSLNLILTANGGDDGDGETKKWGLRLLRDVFQGPHAHHHAALRVPILACYAFSVNISGLLPDELI